MPKQSPKTSARQASKHNQNQIGIRMTTIGVTIQDEEEQFFGCTASKKRTHQAEKGRPRAKGRTVSRANERITKRFGV